MPSYITGNSNYPDNYDLNPTGATTPTISYVLDEIRDENTGVITQSGDTIIAEHVNTIYTIIQHMQQTLGLDITDVFNTLQDRLNYLQYSGNLAFVPLSGGSMFGDLEIQSGSDLLANSVISDDFTLVSTTGVGVSSATVAITASSGLTITTTGSSATINTGDFTVDSSLATINSTNGLYLSGNSIILNSTGNVTVNASILPGVDSLYDLGSTGLKFANIYANNLTTSGGTFSLTTLSGSFVSKSGDTLSGDLTLDSGISILPIASGDGFVGSAILPLSGIYTKQLNASFVSGLSPITVLSNIVITGNNSILFDSGASIAFNGSGNGTIGSLGSPVGTIYADNVISSGLAVTGLVHISGDSMTGSLSMGSGVNISLASGSVYPATSGVGTLGLTGNYFSNVYTNSINDRVVSDVAFNEQAQPTGDPMVFTLLNSPLNGSAMIFVSGVLIIPSVQYQIVSGNYIVMTGSMFTPGSGSVYAGFYLY
jgi:hypothetical protein